MLHSIGYALSTSFIISHLFSLVLCQDTTSPSASATSSSLPALNSALVSNGASTFLNALLVDVPENSARKPRTVYAVHDDVFSKRDVAILRARQNSAFNKSLLYQISPEVVDAASLRAGTGSVVSTYYSQDTLLGGSTQRVLSHGMRDCLADGGVCGPSAPIQMYSGLGDIVTILEEDIPFDGGVIHFSDRLFTIPRTLSDTLAAVNLTTMATYISSCNSSLDSTPSLTVFVPSDDAFLSTLSRNRTLTASQVTSLVNAHAVQGCMAYSPQLVNGATFETLSGDVISISAKPDGSISVNGDSMIVQSDIVVSNGVVHVIDKPIYFPPSSTSPPPSRPPVYTGAAGWSALGHSQTSWIGVVGWSILVGIAAAAGGNFVIL